MAHALAPHARQCDLDRALLTDDALVLHALVLAAQALVVLDRAKDARAEQAVTLRLEGAVVDGLRLFDLAVGPRQNLFRRRNGNPDLVEDLSRHLRAEKIHNLLIHRLLLDLLVGQIFRLSCPASQLSLRKLRKLICARASSNHRRCGLLDRPPPRAMTARERHARRSP